MARTSKCSVYYNFDFTINDVGLHFNTIQKKFKKRYTESAPSRQPNFNRPSIDHRLTID